MSRLSIKNLFLNPAFFTLLGMVLIVALVIAGNDGDPLALARLGTFYSEGDPNGTQGYDGQFIYYIARNPKPDFVASYLDVPAYRYQRILLPMLGRIFALGNINLIPWTLIIFGLLSQTAGTWAVTKLLSLWGVSKWYALIYGLWVGFSLAIRLDLPETLAFGLIAGAILADQKKQHALSFILYGLALFAKEVTIIFVAAELLRLLIQRKYAYSFMLSLTTLQPYALFQIWLLQTFGQIGIGSGGAMATSFEIIPFMGILRIGSYSLVYMIAMLLVFGPVLIIPALWGIFSTSKKLLAGDVNVVVLSLFFNALAIPFLPFSTYRETGGLLRFACGLVLAGLLYAARYRMKRLLNYSYLWILLNIFLLKS